MEAASFPPSVAPDVRPTITAVPGMQVAQGDIQMGETEGNQGKNEEDTEEDVKQNEVNAILEDLEAALDNTGDSGGAYSFSKSYPDAPNPALNLADLGTVGLPLSARDAEAVKSRCTQAPFGKGERTLVDTSVRDTWEMDASLVSFENPHWGQFIDRISREACLALGVNFEASKPRCELYKLLLYETGSHFLPHVDTEKVKGMFATIIIVLPSRFTGGAAHLSHGSLSSIYDCSSTSHFQTTTMAWYTDVTHEIRPITSGYRLALSYNLVHTTHTLRPALSSNGNTINELHRIFSVWNKADGYDNARQKVVYLLDHEYSQVTLSASAMKGVDAQKVAILDTLAKQLGFGMGFASVCCHLVGPCEEDDPYGYGGSGSYSMVEVETREMTIEHFVDLDGKIISEKLEFDQETETIPAELADEVESGDCDDEDYEGYQGNYAGSLEQWYRRTVLVIWPRWQNHGILYQGVNGFKRACKQVASFSTPSPSLDETELALHIVRKCDLDARLAAEAVCHAAVLWKDTYLWCRAVDSCSKKAGVEVLPDDRKHAAVRLFGWSKLVPSFEKMLQHDSLNATRLNFLKRLQQWADTPQNPPLPTATVAEIRAWVTTRTDEVLAQLKKPEISECATLLEVVHAQGGITYLRERMLPQLLVVAEEGFLREFAKDIHNDKSLPDSNEKKATLATLLSTAVSKTTFYKSNTLELQKRAGYPYYGLNSYQRPAPDQSALAMTYVKLCVELDCISVIGAVISRVMDNTNLSPGDVRDCAKTLMLPLVSYCAEYAKSHPQILQLPRFQELQTAAVNTFLDNLAMGPKFSNAFTRAQAATLIDAAVIDGDPTVFVGSIAPKLETMKLGEVGWKAMTEELSAKRERFVFQPGYTGRSLDDILLAFGKKVVSSTTLQSTPSIISILDWSVSVNIPQLRDVVITHITSSTFLNSTVMLSMLASAIPELRQWGDRNGCTDELGPAFQKILHAWTDNILGPLPASNASLAAQLKDLSKWNNDCNCAHCVKARNFITKSPAKSESFSRIGAPARKHLEQKLSMHARSLVTFEIIYGSPQGLTVSKSTPLFQLVSWRANQTQGLAIVKSVGNTEADIQRRLGAQYHRVMSALRGGFVPSNAAASSSQGEPPAKRQRV